MEAFSVFDSPACAKRVSKLVSFFPTVDCSASFSARRPASSGVNVDRNLVLLALEVNTLPRERIVLLERAFMVSNQQTQTFNLNKPSQHNR
jgi:hypothetical protein